LLLVFAVLSHGPLAVTASAVTEDHHEAAAEHHEEGGHHHAPSIGDLLFPAINFAIYLVIVVRFVIPAMREYLRRRRADVVQLESEAGAALTRAQANLAASKARVAGLKKEADGVRQDLVTIATRQAERLKSQAEEMGARRLADASLLAEQERRRALAGLRAELAEAATELAESRLQGALTSDDQRAFVQQFLKDASAR
jgi:F0F1-type ATP synthase membrane subunit b/b'